MRKSDRLGVGLATLNALLLVILIGTHVRSLSASQTAPVLRGSALEIVDEGGRVRASIRVHGPETVGDRRFPSAVVLRMGDPSGEPGVKLAASADGAGLDLSAGHRLSDGRSAGIQLHADNQVILLIDKQGRGRALRP
jgi:hypothetical protein